MDSDAGCGRASCDDDVASTLDSGLSDDAEEVRVEQSGRRRAETSFASPAILHAGPRGDLLSADSESVRAGVLAAVLANDRAAVVLSSDSAWLCFRTDLGCVFAGDSGPVCGVGCWSLRQRRLTLVRRRYLAPGDTDRSTGPVAQVGIWPMSSSIIDTITQAAAPIPVTVEPCPGPLPRRVAGSRPPSAINIGS